MDITPDDWNCRRDLLAPAACPSCNQGLAVLWVIRWANGPISRWENWCPACAGTLTGHFGAEEGVPPPAFAIGERAGELLGWIRSQWTADPAIRELVSAAFEELWDARRDLRDQPEECPAGHGECDVQPCPSKPGWGQCVKCLDDTFPMTSAAANGEPNQGDR